MASATAMVRPPPPGRPAPPPQPPSAIGGSRPKPPAPPNVPPPPHAKRVPPPPPPLPKPAPPAVSFSQLNGKHTLEDVDMMPPKRVRNNTVSIRAPVVLRDVNVFLKKHQVGQGTYGSVFVGHDKLTKEVVALKRINTEQEENGFPITAIREVKILKALRHENIVTLNEIVTSKGAFMCISVFIFVVCRRVLVDKLVSCPISTWWNKKFRASSLSSI
jgi:Protein kinase domain